MLNLLHQFPTNICSNMSTVPNIQSYLQWLFVFQNLIVFWQEGLMVRLPQTITHRYVWYSLKPLLYSFTFVNDRLFLILVNPKSLLIKSLDVPYDRIFPPWNFLLRLMSCVKPLNTHDLTHNKRNYWYRLPRLLYHWLNSNCKPEYTFVHDQICLPHYIL